MHTGIIGCGQLARMLALSGWNLGSTRVNRFNGIINILGPYNRDNAMRTLSRDATLTDYNKSTAPRRKLGHINVSSNSREDIIEELGRIHHSLYQAGNERARTHTPYTHNRGFTGA